MKFSPTKYNNENYHLPKRQTEEENIIEETRKNLQKFLYNLKHTEIPLFEDYLNQNDSYNRFSFGGNIKTEPNPLIQKKNILLTNTNGNNISSNTPKPVIKAQKLKGSKKPNRLIIKQFNPLEVEDYPKEKNNKVVQNVDKEKVVNTNKELNEKEQPQQLVQEKSDLKKEIEDSKNENNIVKDSTINKEEKNTIKEECNNDYENLKKEIERLTKENTSLIESEEAMTKEKEELKLTIEELKKDNEELTKSKQEINELLNTKEDEKNTLIKENNALIEENNQLKDQTTKKSIQKRFQRNMQISIRKEVKFLAKTKQDNIIDSLPSFSYQPKEKKNTISNSINQITIIQKRDLHLTNIRVSTLNFKPINKQTRNMRKKVISFSIEGDIKENKETIKRELIYCQTKMKELVKIKNQMNSFEKEKEGINKELSIAKKAKEDLQKKMNEMSESLQKTIKSKEKEIEELKDMNDKLSGEKDDCESEMILLNQEIATLKDSLEKAQKNEDNNKEKNHLQKENDILTTTLKELQKNKKELEIKVSQLTGDNESLKNEIKQLQNTVSSKTEETPLQGNEELQKENDTLKSKNKELEIKLQKNDESVNILNTEIRKLKATQTVEKSKNNILTKKIEQLTKELKDLKDSKNDEKSEQPTSGTDTSKLKSQVNLLKKRNDLLEKQTKDQQIQIEKYKSDLAQKEIEENEKKLKLSELIEKGFDEGDNIDSLKEKNTLLRIELMEKQETFSKAKNVLLKAKSFDECSKKFSIISLDYQPKNENQSEAFETLKVLFGQKEAHSGQKSDGDIMTHKRIDSEQKGTKSKGLLAMLKGEK